MNTYILVLTLLFKSGYAGMGGVTTIEAKNFNDCNRIGNAWISDIKQKRTVNTNEAVYTCIKK